MVLNVHSCAVQSNLHSPCLSGEGKLARYIKRGTINNYNLHYFTHAIGILGERIGPGKKRGTVNGGTVDRGLTVSRLPSEGRRFSKR